LQPIIMCHKCSSVPQLHGNRTVYTLERGGGNGSATIPVYLFVVRIPESWNFNCRWASASAVAKPGEWWGLQLDQPMPELKISLYVKAGILRMSDWLMNGVYRRYHHFKKTAQSCFIILKCAVILWPSMTSHDPFWWYGTSNLWASVYSHHKLVHICNLTSKLNLCSTHSKESGPHVH